MSISAIGHHQETAEGILKMTQALKNIVNTEMNLQEKMMKVNVTENIEEAAVVGKNVDVSA